MIFDLDGTIVDVPYDWTRIKADLGTGGRPILEYLQSLDEPERSRKWAVLEEFEHTATQLASLKHGVPELLNLLTERDIRTALVSNNSLRNVSFLLKKFGLRFDKVMAREDGLWKPSGAPFQHVLEVWSLNPGECGVVGDSLFDIRAAQSAGIPYILIVSSDTRQSFGPGIETFTSIPELQARLSQLIS
jgi:HAD superfamily hydrolase (TIGR01549 family)